MQKSKLIQLLRTLSEVELKQLGFFLKSPFHNSNKRVLDLFNLLQPYHARNYESNRLQKEILFYKIFPVGTTYQDSNMRTLISNLNQRIEDFLIEREVKKDKVLRQELLARVYSHKNLYPAFEKINRQQNTQLAQLEVQDMEVHQQSFNNNWAYYFHPHTKKYHTKVPSLEQTMYHLDQFYLQAKFRLGLEMKNREKILQEHYDIFFWEILGQEIKHNKNLQTPLFQLHIIGLQLQKSFNLALFKQAFQLYTLHVNSFGDWEKIAFLQLLLNLMARQTYIGNQQYFKQMHELHKLGLEKKLLINNQQISFSIFYTIAGTAFFLKKFDWGENFIKNYKKFLSPIIQTDMLALVEAYKHFYKNRVIKEDGKHLILALKYLSKINNNSLRFSLHSRTLQLRIYYDYYFKKENNFELFMDYAKAFQKFLERNTQLSDIKKIPYQNFINYSQKIAQLQINPNRNLLHIQQLKTKLEQETILFSKIWLKEKLEEL